MTKYQISISHDFDQMFPGYDGIAQECIRFYFPLLSLIEVNERALELYDALQTIIEKSN